MKNLLLSLLLIPATVFAIPNQSDADKWISLALQVPDEVLSSKGPWKCEYIGIHPASYSANGKSARDSSIATKLRCMKDQCEQIGQRMENAIQELRKLDQETLDAFLESLAYDPERREAILRQISEVDPKSLTQIGCENGSPSVRLTVVDLCQSVPVECSKRN